MRTTIIFLSLWMVLCFTMSSQSRIVLNNNAYIVITNSANLVVDNSAANAIITAGTGGNLISEGEFNVVKWNIRTATGNYIIPFTTRTTLTKIPLSVNITAAGTNTGSIVFSTYETATDLNTAYPSDVTNMNSNCNTANALYAIDRFWRIDAINYTTKPTPVINFGYDDAANELSGTNTITESRLKAERFNSVLGAWQTPQKLYGLGNPALNTVSGVSVTPADFYKSWTLIDTVIMTIPISQSSANTSTICSGNTVTITPTGASTYTLFPGGTTGTTFTVSPIATTIYSVSGTNAAGCTSAPSSYATSTVNVNTTPTVALGAISNGTVCSGTTVTITPSGAVTYTLLPGNTTGSIFTVTPNSTTVYTVNGTSTAGCTSTNSSNLTTTVTVNATPTVALGSISNGTICSGNTVTITPSGATTYTLLPGNTTGSVFTVTPSTTTVYTVNGTSTAGCASTNSSNLTTTVVVNTTPTVALGSISSNTICSNNTVTITPSGASTYTLLPDNIVGTLFTVTPLATTVYTINGSSTASCTSTSLSNLTTTVTVDTTPTVSIGSISSTSICSGNSSVLVPTGANTYTLLPDNIVGATFTLSPTSTVVYTVSGTSNGGCTSSSLTSLTTTLTVNSTPTIALGSISNDTVCVGNNVIITPSGAISYTLLPGNLTGTIFTVSPTSSTVYTITGSDNNNCVSNSASVLSTSVTVSNMLITILNQADVLCYGTNTGSASIVVTGGIPSYTYSWINGSTTSTVSGLQVGVNTVTVTDNFNCIATGSITLSEPSSSVSVSSSSITSACPNKSNGSVDVFITGGTPTYSVLWNTGATGATLLNVQTGTYVATITDANGCVLSEMVIIPLLSSTDVACEDLFIPEIFSPNGDGLNEKFEIKKVGAYPNNSISIFNRWGSLIYKKDKYNNDWDGKANIGDALGNNKLPAGTYYVVFEFGDNETKPYTGFVQLEY